MIICVVASIGFLSFNYQLDIISQLYEARPSEKCEEEGNYRHFGMSNPNWMWNEGVSVWNDGVSEWNEEI